jgi:hypothetical protein
LGLDHIGGPYNELPVVLEDNELFHGCEDISDDPTDRAYDTAYYPFNLINYLDLYVPEITNIVVTQDGSRVIVTFTLPTNFDQDDLDEAELEISREWEADVSVEDNGDNTFTMVLDFEDNNDDPDNDLPDSAVSLSSNIAMFLFVSYKLC